MAKTNPIGVRFRQDVLDKLKIDHNVDSPQKALVFMERFYCQHYKLATEVKQILREEKIFPPSDEKIKALGSLKGGQKTDMSEKKKALEFPKKTIAKSPKTLDELKALCPPDKTGFDKSSWIATERQKYNI